MAPGIETYHKPASGIELAVKAQCARYREGLCLISNPRRILSNFFDEPLRLRVTANQWRIYLVALILLKMKVEKFLVDPKPKQTVRLLSVDIFLYSIDFYLA